VALAQVSLSSRFQEGALVSDSNPSGLSDNAAAAIAYLTFVPALIFLLIEPFNRNPFVRFQAWQSILLNITAVLIDFALGLVLVFAVMFLPFAHFAIWRLVELFWLIVWLLCMFNAFNGKRFKLPIIGPMAEKQAGA
jgi:uncharacterized membrane protein